MYAPLNKRLPNLAGRRVPNGPLRIQRGETDADCVIVSVPLKLDPETMSPLHPSIDFSVFVDGTRARSFSPEIAEMRKHPASLYAGREDTAARLESGHEGLGSQPVARSGHRGRAISIVKVLCSNSATARSKLTTAIS